MCCSSASAGVTSRATRDLHDELTALTPPSRTCGLVLVSLCSLPPHLIIVVARHTCRDLNGASGSLLERHAVQTSDTRSRSMWPCGLESWSLGVLVRQCLLEDTKAPESSPSTGGMWGRDNRGLESRSQNATCARPEFYLHSRLHRRLSSRTLLPWRQSELGNVRDGPFSARLAPHLPCLTHCRLAIDRREHLPPSNLMPTHFTFPPRHPQTGVGTTTKALEGATREGHSVATAPGHDRGAGSGPL